MNKLVIFAVIGVVVLALGLGLGLGLSGDAEQTTETPITLETSTLETSTLAPVTQSPTTQSQSRHNGILLKYLHDNSDKSRAFTYRELKPSEKIGNFTYHWLHVTSILYWNETITNAYIWEHQALILIPDTVIPESVESNTVTILIDGGHNTNDPIDPKKEDSYIDAIKGISSKTGTIGVFMNGVPPKLKYYDWEYDDDVHSEDDLLAMMWWRYLFNSHDVQDSFIAPMAKAVIRVMDAVDGYLGASFGVEQFNYIPVGASKRGWTTWLVAIADERVDTAIPIVMSMLNGNKFMHHQYSAYNNAFTFTFQYFIQYNITRMIDTPIWDDLFQLIDPMHFDHEMKDKLILLESSLGDEFFMPDETRAWWDLVPNMNRKLLWLAPKSEHSMAGHIPMLVDQAVGAIKHGLEFKTAEFTPSLNYEYTMNNAENSNIEMNGSKIWVNNVVSIEKVIFFKTHTENRELRDFRAACLVKRARNGTSYDDKNLRPQLHHWVKKEENQDVDDMDWEELILVGKTCRKVKNEKNEENSEICDYEFEIGKFEAFDVSDDDFLGFYFEFTVEIYSEVENSNNLKITTPLFVLPDIYPGYGCEDFSICGNGGLV